MYDDICICISAPCIKCIVLSSSSQVSQSGNIPDIIQYSQDEMEMRPTQEEILNPEPPGST